MEIENELVRKEDVEKLGSIRALMLNVTTKQLVSNSGKPYKSFVLDCLVNNEPRSVWFFRTELKPIIAKLGNKTEAWKDHMIDLKVVKDKNGKLIWNVLL